MNRLAIDTSTAACCVALVTDETPFEHRPRTQRIFEQPAHATELLPAVIEVLQRAGVSWDQLNAIAVGVGPGAFTGLRIGVATARAIATARSLRISPVSSLAALAAGATGHDSLVVPVIDARRGEFYHRLPSGDGVSRDAVSSPEGLIESIAALHREGRRPLAVGEGAVKLAEQLREAGAEVPSQDDSRHVVSAVNVAELGLAVQPLAPNDVVPNYIRPPDAKVSARESWMVTS